MRRFYQKVSKLYFLSFFPKGDFSKQIWLNHAQRSWVFNVMLSSSKKKEPIQKKIFGEMDKQKPITEE